jgi:purine-nucleoside phosphorylase
MIYQPASQFWPLLAMESAGLFAMALLFGAAAVWVVRRQES